jgi:hypothetical protein
MMHGSILILLSRDTQSAAMGKIIGGGGGKLIVGNAKRLVLGKVEK